MGNCATTQYMSANVECPSVEDAQFVEDDFVIVEDAQSVEDDFEKVEFPSVEGDFEKVEFPSVEDAQSVEDDFATRAKQLTVTRPFVISENCTIEDEKLVAYITFVLDMPTSPFTKMWFNTLKMRLLRNGMFLQSVTKNIVDGKDCIEICVVKGETVSL